MNGLRVRVRHADLRRGRDGEGGRGASRRRRGRGRDADAVESVVRRTLGDAEATGTIGEVAPLRAWFSGVLAERDGTAFEFELAFRPR